MMVINDIDIMNEKNITFDGGTTDQKLRTIELTLEVESNLPVYNERTAVENDKFFKKPVHQITTTTIHKETMPLDTYVRISSWHR